MEWRGNVKVRSLASIWYLRGAEVAWVPKGGMEGALAVEHGSELVELRARTMGTALGEVGAWGKGRDKGGLQGAIGVKLCPLASIRYMCGPEAAWKWNYKARDGGTKP